MKTSNNVSTNIIRDESRVIDYVATPNAKDIFERIFSNNQNSNRSFNLIGNYGTGKSTFLWALEKNLNREKIFFSDISTKEGVDEYDFLKIVGENTSLADVLHRELNLKGKVNSSSVLEALANRRGKALKEGKGLVIIIDEFGKFLEFASKNKALDELYLIQQISEWANDERYETYFIITLHQNFSSYGQSLSRQDKLEWEKVKGRFTDLLFNEPVEQLVYFAGKRLKQFKVSSKNKQNFSLLLSIVESSNLVSFRALDQELSHSIYPLDWLSAHVLVNALQRYGQNERSLFSFLNDTTDYSIKKLSGNFYTVSNVYDYLVNSLPAEINSSENPHRAQWLTTFRALEKAELLFEDEFELVAEVIKTISLVNIFSKSGGKFDEEFLLKYFKVTRGENISGILERLKKAGLIRFYKYSNKINFLEGTDIDLEQELISVNQHLNRNFSLSAEILNRIDLPVILAKKYSFITGTNRFFEYKILDAKNQIRTAEGAIDGYINLVFDGLTKKEAKKISAQYTDNIFVLYQNAGQIRNELLMILKYDKLIELHQLDKNALKLLDDERAFHLQTLKRLVVTELFNNDQNIWINSGKVKTIKNKFELYNWISEICSEIYSETPVLINELFNREFLSSPIKTARKSLMRNLLDNEQEAELGFPKDKFPPEKAIYISLLKASDIHKKNNLLDHYELSAPGKKSNLYHLWKHSELFFKEASSNKRNLEELYSQLEKKPFKLKKGFIEFWVPIFLIAKREDYALFHIDGGFIPFITEDTLDLIHKKPQNFLVKSYDVSGLKLNLLESYKELVQIGDSPNQGKQSTFLAIFGNFLRFQRSLTPYTLQTKKLTEHAIKLRKAIIESRDPEEALFDQFPAALDYHVGALKEDEQVLSSFTKHVEDAIREIRISFDELLGRIEREILSSFYCQSTEYSAYKEEIRSKIGDLNKNALGQVQRVYFERINSPLDDRVSWLKSVADVALGKSVEELLDEEEPLLINKIKDLSEALIKAAEIGKYNYNSRTEKLYAIRFFDATGEPVDEKMVVNLNPKADYKAVKDEICTAIQKLDKTRKKELLIELLSRELED